jgi:hypothetical protein
VHLLITYNPSRGDIDTQWERLAARLVPVRVLHSDPKPEYGRCRRAGDPVAPMGRLKDTMTSLHDRLAQASHPHSSPALLRG